KLDRTDAATQQCQAVARFMDELHLPSIVVEKNGIGGFLPGLLRRALADAGLGCAVVEKANTQPKHARILDALDARLDARMIRAHRSVWSTPFIAEMREWRPYNKAPDDGL